MRPIGKSNTSFEKQFSKKEYLDSSFGCIEIIDIIPQVRKHIIPILLAPGWGETLELQKVCIKELYQSGRRVIALRHALLIRQAENETRYPVAEVQKSCNSPSPRKTKTD